MNKAQHPFDDLFRRELTDLEISPSAAGRSSFLEMAGKELRKKQFRYRWFIIGGMAVAVFFIAGIVIMNDHSDTVPSPKKNAINSGKLEYLKNNSLHVTVTKPSQDQRLPEREKISKPSAHINSLKQDISNKKPQTEQSSEIINNKANYNTTIKAANLASSKNSNLKGEKMTIDPLMNIPGPPAIEGSGISLTEDSSVLAKPLLNESVEVPVTSHEKQQADTADLLKTRNLPIDTIHLKSSTSRKKEWNISAGIYYTPEWIFNTLDSNKYVNNFGAEAAFHFGPYSIRTGVGISITRGYHEMVIETQPYLGGYNSLDYITYQWDERHYHLIPTIYTTWKDVFDTVLQYNYYYYEKRYTYLQVPFILGYDFLSNKRWSLGLRAGPVMSLLLKSQVLSGGFDAGKNMIISINNVTPERIQLNWQALAGINAAFHLFPRFSFEFEPNIRYYFDSVYEKKGTADKPWSLGFHAAFLFNF